MKLNVCTAEKASPSTWTPIELVLKPTVSLLAHTQGKECITCGRVKRQNTKFRHLMKGRKGVKTNPTHVLQSKRIIFDQMHYGCL
jgi:hypothetical protein